MRILFSSLGTPGHTFPLIPLAVAARSGGHDVLFATSTELHDALGQQELAVVPAGLSIRGAFSASAAVDPRTLPDEERNKIIAKVFGDVLPRGFIKDLAPVIERFEPELVIQELGNPGAGIAAKAAGVPVLVHGFGRIALDSSPFDRTAFAALAAEFGVTGLGADPVLDICPLSLQDKRFLETARRIPLRPVPLPEAGPAVDYRTNDRPLIYLTLGTAMGSVEVFRQAIEGLATADAEVLAAAGPTVDIEALGELPGNVRVLPWVRQADLLQHAALAVHHGGSGTTLGALAAGVPQLFLPQGADQFDNAEAVTALGAGLQLVGADFDAGAVADTAKVLLAEPGHLDAARAVAAEIAAMPSPDQVATELPDHLT